MSLKGWLANPERRRRRDEPNSFTDEDAKQLITTIEGIAEYTKKSLGPSIDRLARLRDKALIATAWIFFKRASEILRLKRKDVAATDMHACIHFFACFSFSVCKRQTVLLHFQT